MIRIWLKHMLIDSALNHLTDGLVRNLVGNQHKPKPGEYYRSISFCTKESNIFGIGKLVDCGCYILNVTDTEVFYSFTSNKELAAYLGVVIKAKGFRRVDLVTATFNR